MPEQIVQARLQRIIFQNPSTCYVVALFKDLQNHFVFTATGHLEDPMTDQDYEMRLEPSRHPVYGKQYKILSVSRLLPKSEVGIIRFLSGRHFPGIGKASARAVVDALGEDCLDEIRLDPGCLLQVPGLAPKKVRIIADGVREFTDAGNYVKLLQWGIPSSQITLLQQQYDDVMEVIEEDPFRPLYEVYGFGYKSALKLADAMEVERTDQRRLDALLYENTRELSMRTGNTYVTLAQLYETVRGLAVELFEDSLDRLEKKGCLESENQRVYPFGLLEDEKCIARELQVHDYEVDKPEPSAMDAKIKETEFALGITYDEAQKEAIRQFLSASLMILNGGPGTGKTTVVRAILSMYRSFFPNEKIQLAAPTGRAAKRLGQLSDNDARTIHSLLRWNLEDNTFAKDEEDPLDCDVLIVDEFSMVDTHLFASLLRALPAHCRLLLIGDEDQLESVGPGKVFQDLITSNVIPVVHLDHIFRQSQGSGIISLASEIRNEKPLHYEQGVEFVQLSDDRIVDEIVQRVESNYDPDRCQALAPMYTGAAGIDAVNARLQQVLNPPAPGKMEFKAGDVVFREGDKVMLKKNRPDEDIYNGDMGVICEIDPDMGVITVDFGECLSDFSHDHLYYLDHAWCVSVHKAQGSEYDTVYCVTASRNPAMLNKKLLYTAVSRAKKQLVLLGSQSQFEHQVRLKQKRVRQTTLKQRVCEAFGSVL